MSDTDKLYDLLLAAGDRGVFSGDIRKQGISGNPSQRIAELESKGHTIRSVWEKYPSDPKRRGKRYFLVSPVSLSAGDAPAPLLPPVARASSSRHAIDDDWDWEAA